MSRAGAMETRRLVAGNAVFFPLATAYAIFVLPASVSAMLGLSGAFPALASPFGHVHEMLFGFSLAVVAGNQLGPMVMPRLAALAGLWAIARLTFLAAPHSAVAGTANIALAVYDPQLLLVIASAAWSSAFALLFVSLVSLRPS